MRRFRSSTDVVVRRRKRCSCGNSESNCRTTTTTHHHTNSERKGGSKRIALGRTWPDTQSGTRRTDPSPRTLRLRALAPPQAHQRARTRGRSASLAGASAPLAQRTRPSSSLRPRGRCSRPLKASAVASASVSPKVSMWASLAWRSWLERKSGSGDLAVSKGRGPSIISRKTRLMLFGNIVEIRQPSPSNVTSSSSTNSSTYLLATWTHDHSTRNRVAEHESVTTATVVPTVVAMMLSLSQKTSRVSRVLSGSSAQTPATVTAPRRPASHHRHCHSASSPSLQQRASVLKHTSVVTPVTSFVTT